MMSAQKTDGAFSRRETRPNVLDNARAFRRGREPSLFRYPKADEDKLIPRRRKMFGPARQGYIKDTDGENVGKGMEIENRF